LRTANRACGIQLNTSSLNIVAGIFIKDRRRPQPVRKGDAAIPLHTGISTLEGKLGVALAKTRNMR
jgi:hypothetical protein